MMIIYDFSSVTLSVACLLAKAGREVSDTNFETNLQLSLDWIRLNLILKKSHPKDKVAFLICKLMY